MKYLLILIFCFLFPGYNHVVIAANITGIITDSENKTISTATVVLLKKADNSLVQSAITDESGRFSLEKIDTGIYALKVTMLGYNAYSRDISVTGNNIDIKDIKLVAKDNRMKEVTVKGQKPLIEVRADKLIVNVENSAVNAGSSALEILSRTPGVNVDQNDNISIKGKQGVNVMIDGKNMVVSGTDLANMLKSMPSSNISQIEVISNPGARYDAAGTAGIINIRTKRDRNMGLSGSVNASYAQGVYPKYNGGINLNYRNKKVSAYVSYNYSRRWWFNYLDLDRKFYTENNDALQFQYKQENFMKMPMDNHSGSFGLDYSIGKRTIVGVAGTAGNTAFERETSNISRALNGNEELIYNFITAGGQTQDYNNYSANASLRHGFNDKGEKLDIDLDYARYWNTSIQNFETLYTNADGSLYQPNYFMRAEMNGITQIRAFKADYSLPFENNATFDAGVKATYVTSDNEPLFYEKTIGDYALDTKRSNHFIYRENINAGYLNYNKKWEKWSTQIGLRMENTNVEAEQITLDSLYEISYTQLFPSFAVQRNLNEKHDIGITLSRRIQRPNYEQLNPFRFFIDNTTYKQGYPYLRPALTYAAELSHTFKKRFITSVGYSNTTDNITEVIQPSDTEDSVTVQTNKNLASMNSFSISASYPIQVTRWWNSMNNITGWYAHFTGFVANTRLNNGSPAFSAYSHNNFSLGKGYRAELTFWYQSQQVYGFFDLKSMWTLGAGIQKTVLKEQGTIRLSANDIFWRGLPRATSIYTSYREDFTVKRETRQVALSFSYRFGDKKMQPTRRRTGGADDEKNRVGNGAG